ncbi:MAG: host attachment protein [Sphingomonadales bacterium]|nr:host attachment protein [Sphingomonadales bacterium]
MIIRHGALVLVADGKKYLLLRNSGTLQQPTLVFDGGGEIENPPTSAQGSDGPGRAFGTGAVRSAMGQTDFHQLAEDRFAADIAAILGRLAQAADFDELIVVAPPKALAELRDCFDGPVRRKVVAEVPKDLTKHPVGEITAILQREGEAG